MNINNWLQFLWLRAGVEELLDLNSWRKWLVNVADPIQINQGLMNLCINASQAMEETGGILEITVSNVALDEK